MADFLGFASRTFYERTKFKVILSIVIAGIGMMLLGFTSMSGGLSLANDQRSKANRVSQLKVIFYDKGLVFNNQTALNESFTSLAGGYGFATFAFIIAFLMLMGAAIYISPIIFGSANEKKMLRTPQSIEGFDEYESKAGV